MNEKRFIKLRQHPSGKEIETEYNDSHPVEQDLIQPPGGVLMAPNTPTIVPWENDNQIDGPPNTQGDFFDLTDPENPVVIKDGKYSITVNVSAFDASTVGGSIQVNFNAFRATVQASGVVPAGPTWVGAASLSVTLVMLAGETFSVTIISQISETINWGAAMYIVKDE